MAERKKHEPPVAQMRPQLAAMGIEAEFVLLVDDAQVRPEELFDSPRDFVRDSIMHRQGTSYHLPTGGAIYFDTGVIELATPVIEIERGCAVRAGRSLWESLRYTRDELDAWDAANDRSSRLAGFSTHYNVSFELPHHQPVNGRSVEQLAYLLAWILPVPVMLFATNRRSTGVGVRPRRDRIEVTVDFTPSPALMIATATLIVGIVREVMRWERYDIDEVRRHDLPVIREFRPVPHTTRHGWLARFSCFPSNPFTCDIDRDRWETVNHGLLTLRDIAARIVRTFQPSIRRVSDPFTLRLIGSVIRGHSASLLQLPDRPPEYDDVGRLCTWDERQVGAQGLDRSRYERVLIRALSGQALRLGPRRLRPIGMDGWTAVVFRSEDDGRRQTLPIHDLVQHLGTWEQPAR